MAAGLEAIFRWIHVFVGIIWIGHLYFFNWVNGPLQTKLDGPTKKAVVPELMPRALYWFRWGAAWTWITGITLLSMVFYQGKTALENPNDGWVAGSFVMMLAPFIAVFIYDGLWKTPFANDAKNLRAAVVASFVILGVIVACFAYVGLFGYRGTLIHTGALLGTIMAFNVWFRIWPAQQKIIKAVKDGVAPDAALVKLAGMRSRHNTYMSVPLIWTMINTHSTYFAGGNLGIPRELSWTVVLVVIVIAWHGVFQCYKRAAKVQGF